MYFEQWVERQTLLVSQHMALINTPALAIELRGYNKLLEQSVTPTTIYIAQLPVL